MRLGVEFSPDLAALMRREVEAGERAVSRAMADAGADVKSSWRSQVVGAGLGVRLGNSIRAESYPKSKPSLNAAALVWSKAPKIIAAHEGGALIRAKGGLWLAIPTPEAGKGPGGRKLTPAEWEGRRGLRLRFVYRRNGASLLVAEARLNARGVGVASRSKSGRGVATVPIFVMVRQVTLRRRMDFDRDVRRVLGGIPGAIVRNWTDTRFG